MDEMWTDVLRDPTWFDLNSQPHDYNDFRDTLSYLHKLNYTVPGSLLSTITLDIPWTRVFQHQGRNMMMFMSGEKITKTSQSCKCMSITRLGDIDRYETLGFDESVGHIPPQYAIITKREGYSGEVGEFWSFDPEFHAIERPSSIVVTNLKKTLLDGVLHRTDGKPALTAGHVIARWFDRDQPIRYNGPSQIKLSGYREYHIHGRPYKVTYEKIEMYWGDRGEPKSVDGPVFPLHTRYFGNPQDAFIWAASNEA